MEIYDDSMNLILPDLKAFFFPLERALGNRNQDKLQVLFSKAALIGNIRHIHINE